MVGWLDTSGLLLCSTVQILRIILTNRKKISTPNIIKRSDDMFWYFIILASIVVIYLSYLIWWEYWGQFMFNRIIIKKE